MNTKDKLGDISINLILRENKPTKIKLSKKLEGKNNWKKVKDIIITEGLDVKVFDIERGEE